MTIKDKKFDKKIQKIITDEYKDYNNIFKNIKKDNICGNIFLMYSSKYQSLINYEIDKEIEQENFPNNDNKVNKKKEEKLNINLALDISSKNDIMTLIHEHNDNDIHELIWKWLYNLFINIISDSLLTLLNKKENIKGFSKQIEYNIKELIINKYNIIDKLEQDTLLKIVSNSLLANIINSNINNIILGKKELILLDITQKLNSKIKKSILSWFKYIDSISNIIYNTIVFIIKSNNINYDLYYENFETILNSMEFNYQRELIIFNTFHIFNKYLKETDHNLFSYNNLFLINKDVFISDDSLIKLNDNINFSVLNLGYNENNLKLLILENLHFLINLQKQYILKNDNNSKHIQTIETTFANNLEKITKYILNLYKDNKKDLNIIITKIFHKDIWKIKEDIWKIDNFIEFINEKLDLSKTRVNINWKDYFINKIVDKKFPKFKKEYYINKEIKNKINIILLDLYKKIYIKELFDTNNTISNILLLWPTWSGKTFFAKSLAKEFNTPLVKIDASFLKSEHTFTNIVWAPPSYIWSDTLSNWQEKVKNINEEDKTWVLLIDEIEKAHPDILDLFLWLLDEWEIILSNWTILNLRKFIVIFTSNLIQEDEQSIWFNPIEKDNSEDKYWEKTKEKLLEFFKPEFLWRIDKVELIPAYKEEDLLKIYNFIADKLIKQYKLEGKNKEKINKILQKSKKDVIAKTINTKENIRLLWKEIEKIIIDNFIIK